MNKPLVPFGWMPGHWGLKGKTRQIAEAEYYLSGYDLAIRLVEIECDDVQALSLRKLEIDHKFAKIDAYDYAVKCAELQLSGTDLELRKLKIDLEHHRISQANYDKNVADLRGEPYVNMPDIRWDPNDPSRSYFELDYNEHFVLFLRDNRYTGTTSEEVVEKWLNDVCRSVAQEGFIDDTKIVTTPPVPTKKRNKKSKTEYS
jgi:hypothetical protein